MDRCRSVVLGALALLLLGSEPCADGEDFPATSSENPSDSAVHSSVPIGKVGLMVFDAQTQVPQVAGMGGTVRGYIVSHPAIPGALTIRRNGQEVPVLRFTLNFQLTNTSRLNGTEVVRGRGNLEIFYHREGVAGGVHGDWNGGEMIEVDDIKMTAELGLYDPISMIRMRESSIATKPFTFAGRGIQTPIGRRAMDIMFAELDPEQRGLAVASATVLLSLGPAAKFESVAPKLVY